MTLIEAAIRWMHHYARPMDLKVFGLHALEPQERDARILLAYPRERGAPIFNKPALMRSPHKSKMPTMHHTCDFHAALERLEEVGSVHKLT